MHEMTIGPKPMSPAQSESFGWWKDATITLALFLFCSLILFHNLGGPALFEPDEGRNAEKAREILLTQDWVTPHENFLPVLDKPIFFYWLIAFCYKFFSVSEWAARLPSALAGLGTIVLIYIFVRKFFGLWEALWSGLILVTNMEFFLLSRTVIFDMVLTFFITLSLYLFYCGLYTDIRTKRKIFLLLMYASMAAGTLVKGPIGFVLPAIVIFFYLLLARRLYLLWDMDLLLGGVLFILIVAPWNIWVEIRNPGYLRYFLWEENFVRFLTSHFHRSGAWYYFFIVLAVGFLPWIFLLPCVVKAQWKRPIDQMTLFLVVWTVLPFLFFSFSDSKLPHYILPIFPPLAILVGQWLASNLKNCSEAKTWPLWLPALNLFLVPAMWIGSTYWPDAFPQHLEPVRDALHEVLGIPIFGMLLGIILLSLASWKHFAIRQGSLYLLCCIGFALFFLCIQPILEPASLASSSKSLAEQSGSFIRPEDQVVIFDTYLSSLPFYFNIDRPIWYVWSGRKSSVMGSFYVAEQQPQPAAQYGKALLTFEEFSKQWETSERRLFVFVKDKNLPRIADHDQNFPNRILQVNKMALVANR
jgi:4-amino-4-deoxy-L-arabinose transferase-like glycosyltransferase